jgi:ANTAR domain-containing protein
MSASDRSPDPRRAGARILDTAEGVLIALRGCTLNQAFVEIVQTAKRHNVSTLSMADALVAIAQTQAPQNADNSDAAFSAARETWGHFFDQRPLRRPLRLPPRQLFDDDDEDDGVASGA